MTVSFSVDCKLKSSPAKLKNQRIIFSTTSAAVFPVNISPLSSVSNPAAAASALSFSAFTLVGSFLVSYVLTATPLPYFSLYCLTSLDFFILTTRSSFLPNIPSSYCVRLSIIFALA